MILLLGSGISVLFGGLELKINFLLNPWSWTRVYWDNGVKGFLKVGFLEQEKFWLLFMWKLI